MQACNGFGMSAAKNSVHPLVGCLFKKTGNIYRVMVVCENYAMMRAKGFVPFCVYVKDLESEYSKVETSNESDKVGRTKEMP